MKKKITKLCQSLTKEFDQIPVERQQQLRVLSNYLAEKYAQEKTPKAIVVCTHNSRRSHLGQLWLAIGADYYQLPSIDTYSGGTEATAFNIRAVKAFQKLGLEISTDDKHKGNPKYSIQWKERQLPYIAFSKKYDEAPNPSAAFAAIMVCTSADKGCPIISGCDFRLSLPYEDPKAFDDTPLEAQMYEERCRQIGREILFAMKQVKLILSALG